MRPEGTGNPSAQLRAFGQGIARDVTALRARLIAAARANGTYSPEELRSIEARIHNATHGALEQIAQAITAAGLHPHATEHDAGATP